MGRYVDLHAHFLPALDDGAPSVDVSMRMVGALASLGFGVLNATPHQRAGMFMPTREAIDAAFNEVRGLSQVAVPGLEFGVAAENFWDEVFHERVQHGGLPCYTGGKAFLFEVNTQLLPARLEQTLFSIHTGGRLPVMAHPERYRPLQGDFDRAESLARTAALVVDLGSVDGAHGRAEMKFARRLLEEGLAHAVTSDMHTAEDQRPISAGMAWVKKRLGAPALERLLADNPRRILAGELPD